MIREKNWTLLLAPLIGSGSMITLANFRDGKPLSRINGGRRTAK